jgi:hypothetical protein
MQYSVPFLDHIRSLSKGQNPVCVGVTEKAVKDLTHLQRVVDHTFSATPYTVPIKCAPTIRGIRLASTTLSPRTPQTSKVSGSTTPPASFAPFGAVYAGESEI